MKEMTPGAALNHLAAVTVSGWYCQIRYEMEHLHTIGIGKANDIARGIQKDMDALHALEKLVYPEAGDPE